MNCSSYHAFQAITDFNVMPQISSDVVGYDFVDQHEHEHEHDNDNDPPPPPPPPPEMHLHMRFSETRRMGGGGDDSKNLLITNLQVTEFHPQEPYHARMVADTHGTIWDTTFDVISTTSTNKQQAENDSSSSKVQEEEGVVSTLQISMHARGYEWIPKFVINPIMQVVFRYGLNKHIDQVKIWCEKQQ